MAFPAQTISGEIVSIVDKATCATGQLVEVFTDEDGVRYTRDLMGAHAPHILIPLDEKLEQAEAVVEKVDEATGSFGDSLFDKVEDTLKGVEEVVETVEKHLTGEETPSTEK
jgi:exonuclease VII small subunit